MLRIKTLVLGSVLCLVAAACYADSVTTIPITGSTYDGFATTEGNYKIQGPGLNLWQSDLGGPSFIGYCIAGTVCNFTWTPAHPGILQLLHEILRRFIWVNASAVAGAEPALQGISVLFGGDTLTMSFTVSGTIDGFQLVGCDAYGNCSLGPQAFALNISGTGTEILTINNFSGTPSEIVGLEGTFSGTATPITTTPEPGSMILMGTGLAGVWIKRRRRVHHGI